MKYLSIYIHIPFCEQKCLYCDFASMRAGEDMQAKYKDAIVREINSFDSSGYVVDTIFVGGGTPTCVSVDMIADIIAAVKSKFELELKEFTIEGNPNSFTQEKLDRYIDMGVTRCSIGVQSLDDKVLKGIGRLHDSATAKKCVNRLVGSGLRVSCDLMVGLPYQTLDMVERDVRYLLDSGVGHISCYSLILEPGTPLYAKVNSGQLVLPSEDETVDMYDKVKSLCESYGLARYEISNFGDICQHNYGYWTLKDYVGFGLSAHSLIGNTRYYNTDNIQDYISGSGHILEESLTMEDMAKEYIMLGLRCDRGVNLKEFEEKFGQKMLENTIKIATTNQKYMNITPEYISIKPEYMYVSNSIIEQFV